MFVLQHVFFYSKKFSNSNQYFSTEKKSSRISIYALITEILSSPTFTHLICNDPLLQICNFLRKIPQKEKGKSSGKASVDSDYCREDKEPDFHHPGLRRSHESTMNRGTTSVIRLILR